MTLVGGHLGVQLTLFQPEEGDRLGPPGFENLTGSLVLGISDSFFLLLLSSRIQVISKKSSNDNSLVQRKSLSENHHHLSVI